MAPYNNHDPAPSSSLDLDLTWNRINLALARSQRLLATWLPPAPPAPPASASVAGGSEGQGEAAALPASFDDEPFQTSSEKTGFGYVPPSTDPFPGIATHISTAHSTERLRELLLPGCRKDKVRNKGGATTTIGLAGVNAGNGLVAPKPKPRDDETKKRGGRSGNKPDTNDEDEDGDERGRSHLGRPKSKLQDKASESSSTAAGVNDDEEADGEHSTTSTNTAAKPKPKTKRQHAVVTSYLDEVLAQREAKKKKKALKKEGAGLGAWVGEGKNK